MCRGSNNGGVLEVLLFENKKLTLIFYLFFLGARLVFRVNFIPLSIFDSKKKKKKKG